jgi:hypothetical protein
MVLAAAPGCGGDDGESSSGDADTEGATEAASSATDGDTDSGETAETDTGFDECPDAVLDGSFEEGPNTLGWNTGSTNWETPICNLTCFAGGNRALDGDWWVWFGGVPVPESVFVSQELPIVMGRAELVFHVLVIAETPSLNDTFTVLVDDVNVFQISGMDEPEYEDYVEVRVNLDDFADGMLHTVSFDGNFDGMSTTSFFLDVVELRNCS